MGGKVCFSACSQHEIPKYKCFQLHSGRRRNATSLEMERHHPAAKTMFYGRFKHLQAHHPVARFVQALVRSPDKKTLKYLMGNNYHNKQFSTTYLLLLNTYSHKPSDEKGRRV
jgi:hypothetical protein